MIDLLYFITIYTAQSVLKRQKNKNKNNMPAEKKWLLIDDELHNYLFLRKYATWPLTHVDCWTQTATNTGCIQCMFFKKREKHKHWLHCVIPVGIHHISNNVHIENKVVFFNTVYVNYYLFCSLNPPM